MGRESTLRRREVDRCQGDTEQVGHMVQRGELTEPCGRTQTKIYGLFKLSTSCRKA